MEIVEKYIGTWGLYQIFVYFLLCANFIFTGDMIMAYTFTGAVPRARCQLPGVDNSTTGTFADQTVDTHLDNFYANPITQRGSTIYCHYCPNNTDIFSEKDGDVSFTAYPNGSYYPPIFEGNRTCYRKSSVECPSNDFIYDTSQYRSSIVTKFDLVCKQGAWKRQMASSLYMLGIMLGALVGGYLGDKFGRRPVFLICQFISIITTHLVIVVPNFTLFCLLQVLNASLIYAAYMSGYVIAMELFGGIARTIAGVWVQGIFAIGYIYVGVMAYLIRDWQYLQLALCLPSLLNIPSYWLLPESIRWLILNGRLDEAKTILLRAARWNGREISEEKLSEALAEEKEQSFGRETATIGHLFRHRSLCIMTIIVMYAWFACSMTYYGISLNTTDLPGDTYVNYLISGLIEFPSFVICIPMMEKLGRRRTVVAFFAFGGLCIIVCPFLPNSVNWLIVTLASLGKLAAAASFAVVYNYSAELFPTIVRNAGLGASSSMARIASISAPQIALLGTYVATWLPFLIYGTIAAIGAGLVCFLPETLGKEMPETIEDGIALASGRTFIHSNDNGVEMMKGDEEDEKEIFV